MRVRAWGNAGVLGVWSTPWFAPGVQGGDVHATLSTVGGTRFRTLCCLRRQKLVSGRRVNWKLISRWDVASLGTCSLSRTRPCGAARPRGCGRRLARRVLCSEPYTFSLISNMQIAFWGKIFQLIGYSRTGASKT